MEQNKYQLVYGIFVIIIPLILTLIFINFIFDLGFYCKIQDTFNGHDKYCYHMPYTGRYMDVSTSPNKYGWEMKSHKQDKIESDQRAETERIRLEEQKQEEECYNNGADYNSSFDLIKDYGLSCKQINYINDHLIGQKTSGGYIQGSYSGFFSSGKIKGESYIITESLALGKLVQSIKYHLDCNKIKSNEIIDYYEESEFVNYYVENCLK